MGLHNVPFWIINMILFTIYMYLYVYVQLCTYLFSKLYYLLFILFLSFVDLILCIILISFVFFIMLSLYPYPHHPHHPHHHQNMITNNVGFLLVASLHEVHCHYSWIVFQLSKINPKQKETSSQSRCPDNEPILQIVIWSPKPKSVKFCVLLLPVMFACLSQNSPCVLSLDRSKYIPVWVIKESSFMVTI